MIASTDDRWRIATDGREAAERLRGAVRAAVDATPVRLVGFRAGAGLALAAVLIATAAVVATASSIVYGRLAVGLDVLPDVQLRMQTVLGLLVLLVTGVTYASLTRGRHGLGAPVRLLVASALAAVPAYAVLVLGFPVHTGDPPALTAGVSPWGARCLLVAAAVGLIVLTALAAALHRAVPTASHWRGAAAGAAAGLWSGAAVFVFCPAHELGHLAIGHVAPIAVFLLAGLIALPRVLRS
ncbi:MAG TPA: NrsF family protein [Pseudomonadales bacterium]